MSKAASFDVIVIGAGANGLVAAAMLGRSGLRVLLIEARDTVGGQHRVIEFAPGFCAAPFATGTGWIPPAVARTVGLDVAQRVQPDAASSVAIAPGEFLTLWSNVSRAADALRRHSPRDAGQWPAFANRIHKLAGFLSALYQQPATDIDTTSPRELLAMVGLGRKLRGLGRADMTESLRLMPMSIQDLLDDTFESEPLKALIAAGGVRQLRQGPRSGGTTFNLLHYLVGAPLGTMRDSGWWRSGSDAFIRAAEAAALRVGVVVRTNAAVAHIRVQDDAVTGVVLENGEEIGAPRVVSTADPARTLLGLLDPVWLDPEFMHAVRNIKFRGATTTVLYALDGSPDVAGLAPEMLNGVLSLTPNLSALERAADAAKYGAASEQPHVELSLQTARWPDGRLAPGGKHVLVATAQWSPYHLRDGAAWDGSTRDAFADRIGAVIEAVLPGFGARVLHRVTLTPRDVEQMYGVTEGALTQGEMMLDQILFMRPVPGWGRRAMPIRGLYLGGAGTHPGPGVLGGAGWLAAERVLVDKR
jgi:phytoene dehydrogenase-like protein